MPDLPPENKNKNGTGYAIWRFEYLRLGKLLPITAFHQRGVWTEIAVSRVGNLQLATVGIERGKHLIHDTRTTSPGYE